MNKISFVIPCYGSENTLEQVVKEIRETVGAEKDYGYEIVLVNDNSPDNVFDVIKKLCVSDKQVKAVSLAGNFGQHAALMAGLRHVTGDFVVCLDDDGQTPANAVFSLIEKLKQGHDVAFADYGIKKQSLLKNLGSWVNLIMLRAFMNAPKGIIFSSYFAMRRLVSDEMVKYKSPYPYSVGLILSITRNIVNVKCEDRKRFAGKSGYTLNKLLSLWINGVTNFSTKPLQLATFLGVICGAFGFGFGIYTVAYKMLNPGVPVGYSAIISMISFIGGVILLVLGIIGEYVGRIFISINRMPQYVIKEEINTDDKS